MVATLPIKLRVVMMDRTSDFTIDEADKTKIKRIISYFCYDENRATHVCELTPSYWLVHLFDQCEWADGFDPDDLEREILFETYESDFSNLSDCYMHCRDVKRQLHCPDDNVTLENDGPFDTEEEYNERFDDIRSNLTSNPPFWNPDWKPA